MSDNRRLTLLEVVGLVMLMAVVVMAMHPSLLLSQTLITGGDTGAHVESAAFLRQSGLHTLTPWFPGWFDGMPLYTYYFVLPDLLAVLASYVIPFTVAFKLMTILGSLLMPVGAYLMGRLIGAPRPIPLALGAATLPFLFDASFTIDGGNLFSTMAGEYAFSLSLALAMIAIGLFAKGMRTGRGYWLAAVTLAATLLAHLLPWLFAVVMIAVVGVFEFSTRWRHRREVGDVARPTRFAVGAGLLSFGLVAWWLLPFAGLQSLTNSMGYTNDSVATLHDVFKQLGWWNAAGHAGGDRWVLILAAIGLAVAVWGRDRLGKVLAVWSVLSLAAFVLDPQSAIWNERLVPFWYLGTHLLAGWVVGYALWRAGNWLIDRRNSEARAALQVEGTTLEVDESEVATWLQREHRSITAGVSIVALALGLLSVVPGQVPAFANALHLSTSGNQVSSWSQFNYSGYQGQSGWAEYHDLMTTMTTVGRQYGCGTAMWEYNASESRFGTTMALMLLPYWTNNCIDSMEGLYFESSATTPYHFLDQAELSAAPSDPQVGLNYGPTDVALGVEHLQMLGVRYYMAFTPSVVAQADKDPSLTPVATTQFWASSQTRWHIYLIKNAPVVSALHYDPTVVPNSASRVQWLAANEAWWLHPEWWATPLAMTGPSSWPHSTTPLPMPSSPLPAVTVTNVVERSSQISFDVSKVGVPVEVKISYFPGWHVTGATGPYRVSPNLMVVVPTSSHVTLTYGPTSGQRLGTVITDLTALVGIIFFVMHLKRRRSTHR